MDTQDGRLAHTVLGAVGSDTSVFVGLAIRAKD